MWRERALKIVLPLAGLLFAAAIYPVVMSLWPPSPSDDTGDTMMMSLYFTLGIFLLLAARKPSAHRTLMAFAAWSSFAHAVVMTILGFHLAVQCTGFFIASAVLIVIGSAARVGPAEAISMPAISRQCVAALSRLDLR